MSDFKNAHATVGRAIKAGKLAPVNSVLCADCGEKPAEEYHHYNGHKREHWLDVIPLCLACHGKTRQAPPREKPVFRKHQCEALAKNGNQCPVWAMEDSIYCAAHRLQAKNLIHYKA